VPDVLWKLARDDLPLLGQVCRKSWSRRLHAKKTIDLFSHLGRAGR
jgi:hypothetical protein